MGRSSTCHITQLSSRSYHAARRAFFANEIRFMLCRVDWYQVGGEAFIRAVNENPVYVSKTHPGVGEVATDTNNILSRLPARNYKL